MPDYSDIEYRKAKKRVQAKKGFYSHFGIYAIMGIFFFTLNMLTSPATYWWYWPMLGWGIGIASHYIAVFGIPGLPFTSKEWEEKEIEKELGYSPDDYLDLNEEENPLDLDEQPRKTKIKATDWTDGDLV